jgi:hypothetical protein
MEVGSRGGLDRNRIISELSDLEGQEIGMDSIQR